jgi:hypothetical protein
VLAGADKEGAAGQYVAILEHDPLELSISSLETEEPIFPHLDPLGVQLIQILLG